MRCHVPVLNFSLISFKVHDLSDIYKLRIYAIIIRLKPSILNKLTRASVELIFLFPHLVNNYVDLRMKRNN